MTRPPPISPLSPHPTLSRSPAIIRCDGRHPLSGYAASPSLSGRGTAPSVRGGPSSVPPRRVCPYQRPAWAATLRKPPSDAALVCAHNGAAPHLPNVTFFPHGPRHTTPRKLSDCICPAMCNFLTPRVHVIPSHRKRRR